MNTGQTRHSAHRGYSGRKRHDERLAGKLFERGVTIAVMTADEDTDSYCTSEVYYTKGEELFFGSPDIACTFDQVMEDYARWLESNGQRPCHEGTEHKDFSYWTKNIND